MAARARNDPDPVLASPADGSLHVGKRLAEDDRLRLVRVEAGVVQDARLVVRSITANDYGAANQLRELVEDPARRRPRKVCQPTGERHRSRSEGRVLAAADEQLSARDLLHGPNLATRC